MFKNLVALLVLLTIMVGCNKEEDQINFPPQIFISPPENGFEIDVEDTLLLEPQIIYDYNTTYQWYLDGQTIENGNKRVLKVIPKGQFATFNYSLIVSNSIGSDTLNVVVEANVILDFEEIELEDDSYSLGEGGEMIRASKMVDFPVFWNPETSFWSGFAFSNKYSTYNSGEKNQYSVYNSTGDDDSDNFIILSGEDEKESFITFNDVKPHRVGRLSIASDNYTYWLIRSGVDSPGLEPYVVSNDFLKVLVNGYDSNGNLLSKGEFYIANYLTTNSRESYLLSSWDKINLYELGLVSKIGFKFESSRVNTDGVITPAFLCLDNIRIVE